MGLYIINNYKESEYDYRYSYHMLHSIRWFAAIDCGLDHTFMGELSYFIFNGNMLSVRHLTSQDRRNLDGILMTTSYKYPNLMLHSDCEGSYTKRGKVLKDSNLETGNSLALRIELKNLINSPRLIPLKEIEGNIWNALIAFYNVVNEAIEKSDGKIFFR